MIILGINAYHGDSAAALVVDGQLVAAVEEERFTRIKHWAGLPSLSVAYCLKAHSITLADVDVIAINQDSRANLWRKVGYTLRQKPNPSLIIEKLRTRKERQDVISQLSLALKDDGFKGQFKQVEHHLAHLASAFYVSPFADAALLSVDGFGDFASTAWGVGKANDIRVDERVFFPHSLGSFYQAMTQHLGFPNYGDEFKVMGLAPYGKPTYLEKLRRVVQPTDNGFQLELEFFRHHQKDISFEWRGGAPVFDHLFDVALEDLLGPARKPGEALESRHFDLAHSVQKMYEEVFFHLLELIHHRYDLPHIALAGGCAMNSVANGKVIANSGFEKMYVQSAAGDAGGAIGAGYVVWHEAGGGREFTMSHAYLGPAYNRAEIVGACESRSVDLENCVVRELTDEPQLLTEVATALAGGLVVGWFQGRLEWGARALGHRSILGDPRRADMKEILNQKIKRRESFRPFAPSVLRHRVADWFEVDDDVPFMMKVLPIRAEKQTLIPAVTHVDGSGRLQTVTESDNHRYFRLISAFEEMTEVPMLLNTSFNENEPIVCQPAEALDCFLRTRMDMLVIGDFVITRSDQS